jgi:hypothetical protein
MKIKFTQNAEQIELIKAIGSRDPKVAREASEAFAAFLGPVISKVIAQAGTAPLIYTDSTFDEDDTPSYPLDLFYDQDVEYVAVWSQTMPGGLPSSTIEGVKEMKISTYRLDSAINLLKKYARKARLNVLEKATTKMAQEILVKQERNAWAVVMKALAEAQTKGTRHVIRAETANQFKLDDLNKLLTRAKRINESFAAGTPASFDSKGITDLFVSPEIKEEIRGFAYQPMNTRSGKVDTSGATSVPLPDSIREDIYRAAGTQEIYGVAITELNELGVGKKYNTLFDEFAGTVQFEKADGSGDAVFDGGASGEEILVGVDLAREAFIRPVAIQADSGGTFMVLPDDQFLARSEKVGWYGFLEEGRVCIDSKAVLGLIV